MLTNTFHRILFVSAVFLQTLLGAENALSSWNEGVTKQRILTFVDQVTNPKSAYFVPVEKRIATFDNDGTLLLEKPLLLQAVFTQRRVAQMVEAQPHLAESPAFKAFLQKDPDYRQHLSKKELLELICATHSGMSEEHFQTLSKKFLAEAKDPRFDQLYTKLVYLPMLELMDYLRANGFKVYLCTGGGTEFVRAFAHEVYGVPPEQVIGTAMEMEFTVDDGKPGFMRLNNFAAPFNDRKSKPMYIQRVIGRPPLIAVGNSDGDIEMLQFAKGQKAGLAILIHHDDALREYAYDTGSQEALRIAKEQNWLVVSMKNDFAHVFAQASDASDKPEQTAELLNASH